MNASVITNVSRALSLALLVALAGCADSMPAPSEAEPAHSLVGQRAPQFTVPTLSGENFDLAEHVGEGVVILDFWATWCPPCREALPTLSEVASEFQSRGVALYAVDLGESPETVKEFLSQSGLELNVIMDEDGSVAQAYGADAIPQTVIIDRQGIVRFVHVGTSPNLRERLTSELTELVDGTAAIESPAMPRLR